MRRRDFFKVIAVSTAGWPLAVRAQQPERTRRIGVLMNYSESDPESRARIAALRDGLRRLGWIEGHNIQIEYRWGAGDTDHARTYAAELVAMKPELIFAGTSVPLTALHRATQTIPIVFAQIADPVATGFVASIREPGGNITGFAQFEYEIGAEWVQLLKQIAPSITRVAAIYDPGNREYAAFLPVMDTAARAQGLQMASYAVRSSDEIEHAIETFASEPNGGLIPLPGPIMLAQRQLIIALTAKHRLPDLYALNYYPASGGLASYGADVIDLYRRATNYIDRILKGEKAADLPVQFPTKYQLVINMKTAKALGIEVPTSLLVRADEVIE
jgi:putative tryptophan/tyrosine transport system substrate-binding protein